MPRRAGISSRPDGLRFGRTPWPSASNFGPKAHRLGWTAPELFAVHPEHGTLRVDYCGVLMVVSEPARSVEALRILFERLTGYRNKVGQVWGIRSGSTPRMAQAGELPTSRADRQHGLAGGASRCW